MRALGFGRSVMAGAATMALLVLPIVILSTREALRTVPKSMREGSYALGATKWQTIWHQVLPSAMPSLFTGVILALSRAIGETAPLITIGALTYVPFAPDSIWSPFTVLPIQIFDWLSRPQVAFSQNAAAGIIVLLALLLTMNGVAIFLRDRYQQRPQADAVTSPTRNPVVHATPEYSPPSFARSFMSANCTPALQLEAVPVEVVVRARDRARCIRRPCRTRRGSRRSPAGRRWARRSR